MVFEKEYIMRCSSAEWIECLETMPSWFRQVNRGKCGIPWANCAVLCVKTTGKDSSDACAIACQNCAVYSVFPSGITPHIKIAQFNWQCMGRLTFIVGYLLFSMTLTPIKSNLHILRKLGSIWRIAYWGRTYFLSPKRLIFKVSFL